MYLSFLSFHLKSALLLLLSLQGLEDTDLRTEIYCQLMKQLSSNPDPASEKKGWLLLMICLCAFPPGPSLEYHVQVFIREHASHKSTARASGADEQQARKKSLTDQCHKAAFAKPLVAVPTGPLIQLAEAAGFPEGTTPYY